MDQPSARTGGKQVTKRQCTALSPGSRCRSLSTALTIRFHTAAPRTGPSGELYHDSADGSDAKRLTGNQAPITSVCLVPRSEMEGRKLAQPGSERAWITGVLRAQRDSRAARCRGSRALTRREKPLGLLASSSHRP